MAEKPEDLSLPASVVARIIKDSLPEGVSVSKEARVAIGKAASVFILYCTACSNNFALQAKRKTLAASDVLSALSDMEFEEFVPELKSFLEAYKREQKGKRVAAADRRKQKAVASQAAATTDPQIPPVPTTSQTTQVSVEPSTAAGVDSSSGGVGVVSVSDGVRAEGMDSCGPARDEEAMETDTVVEQTGVGSATAVTSVS